jgi:hypothetical protein
MGQTVQQTENEGAGYQIECVDWLNGLVDWMDGWLIGWLVGWLVC